ncbi:SDR family NAD(P)-dependent oxidoreductase [Hyphomonas sp.]|uniref:SDR family NAD(P)-dependent oxidoreductase n=1 Tax=Hyphomonas sp. TaxID=87 RepID=UPI003919AFE9
MIDYRDKTVLVTGGASGIGKALAEALHARGANIVVADRQAGAAEEVANGLSGRAVACDLAKPEDAARVVNDAFDWTGRLDLVCANAGYGRNKRMTKEPFDEAAMDLFSVNLFAPFRMAQAYAARLTEAGQRGRLMITGSENSLSLPDAVRRNGLGAYAATKHGVLILAEWLREDLRGETMDVHVLMPGGVYTPLIARHIPDPNDLPPEMNIILPERCAEIALKGLDLGLFYIPTHAHIADDMRPRTEGVAASLKALGLT